MGIPASAACPSERLRRNEAAGRPRAPPPPFPGATTATYKVSGTPNVEGKDFPHRRSAIIVTAVATNAQMQGYALLTAIHEKDVAAFDANPAKFERGVTKGMNDFIANTTAQRN